MTGEEYKTSAVRVVYDGGCNNIPWVQNLSRVWLTKKLTKYTTRAYYTQGFFDIAINTVRNRVPEENVVENEKNIHLDLFHRLIVNQKGDALDLEQKELIAEAAIVLIAGFVALNHPLGTGDGTIEAIQAFGIPEQEMHDRQLWSPCVSRLTSCY